MRPLWNCLSDPSLHLLGTALILVALAFSGPGPANIDIELVAESPMLHCARCHIQYFPQKPCHCATAKNLVHADAQH